MLRRRRHAHRHPHPLAQQRHALIDARHIDQHPRPEPPPRERRLVLAQRMLVARPARVVRERPGVHPPPRNRLKVPKIQRLSHNSRIVTCAVTAEGHARRAPPSFRAKRRIHPYPATNASPTPIPPPSPSSQVVLVIQSEAKNLPAFIECLAYTNPVHPAPLPSRGRGRGLGLPLDPTPPNPLHCVSTPGRRVPNPGNQWHVPTHDSTQRMSRYGQAAALR